MVCLECNRQLRSINNQHLKTCCGLTRQEYMAKHNVASLIDPDLILQTRHLGASNGRWVGGNQNICTQCQQPIYKYKGTELCAKCSYSQRRAANPKRAPKTCPVCNELFTADGKKYYRTTCSDECLKQWLSVQSRNNPNCGARAHYIRSKRYEYGGVLMDSTWEVNLAEWLDARNEPWTRDRSIHFRWTDDQGSKRKYFPDFYLPRLDLYVDTKNKYLMKVDATKLRRIRTENSIRLVTGGLEHIKRFISRQQALTAYA